MSTEVISGVEKVKLQEIVRKIEFAENDDKITQFKCVGCKTVALYQYLATCKHIYCGKCHGKVHGKPCLVDGCAKIVITAKQDPILQAEMSNLLTFCHFRNNGCQEEIPLHMYMQHIKICRHSTQKTLPKIYKENPFNLYKEKTDEVINTLKNLLSDLQANQAKLQQKLSSQDERLNIHEKLPSTLNEEVIRNFDSFKKTILEDVTERLSKTLEEQCLKNEKKYNKQTKLFKNLQTIQAEFQTKLSSIKSQLEANFTQKLASSINEEVTRNCNRIKEDILENITERVTIKLEQQRQRESQALSRMEEVVTRGKKETEGKCLKIFKNDKEEMLNWLENKMEEKNEQIETQLGENSKEVTLKITEIMIKELQTTEENMKREIERKFQDVNSSLKHTDQEQCNEEQIQRLSQKYNCLFDYFLEEKSTIFEWVIPRMRDVVQRLKKCQYPNGYRSTIFAIKDTQLKMRAILKYEKAIDGLTISSEFDLKAQNISPGFIYYHQKKFILLDQSEKKAKRDACVSLEPTFGTIKAQKWMMGPAGGSPLILVKSLENGYIKNNSAVIKIIIQPISFACLSYYSNNGVLLWKIDNYKQKKQDSIDGINGILFSEGFYSSENGYRMRVLLGLNKTGINAMVGIHKGEFDDNLPSVFPRATHCFILDQTNLTNKKRLGQNKISYTVDEYPQFIFNYDEIEKPGILTNDSLLIKVMIEPIDVTQCP